MAVVWSAFAIAAGGVVVEASGASFAPSAPTAQPPTRNSSAAALTRQNRVLAICAYRQGLFSGEDDCVAPTCEPLGAEAASRARIIASRSAISMRLLNYSCLSDQLFHRQAPIHSSPE